MPACLCVHYIHYDFLDLELQKMVNSGHEQQMFLIAETSLQSTISILNQERSAFLWKVPEEVFSGIHRRYVSLQSCVWDKDRNGCWKEEQIQADTMKLWPQMDVG